PHMGRIIGAVAGSHNPQMGEPYGTLTRAVCISLRAMGLQGVSGPAVEVEGLEKRYPKAPVNAVDGVTFSVERGEGVGLRGPTAAAKTTPRGVRATGARLPGGVAGVGGIAVPRAPVGARTQLAVVPQRTNLARSLSTRQTLIFPAASPRVPSGERNRRADE